MSEPLLENIRWRIWDLGKDPNFEKMKQSLSLELCPLFDCCNAPVDHGWQTQFCIRNFRNCTYFNT